MRTLVYGCYMLVPVHAGTPLSVVRYYTIPIIYSLCARSVVSSSALPSLARRARRASDRMEAGVALRVGDGTEQEALGGSFFYALHTSIVTFVDEDDKTAAADSRVSAYM